MVKMLALLCALVAVAYAIGFASVALAMVGY